MSNTVLFILMIAALCHAIWNALGKKIEERDAFFTLILGASVVLWFPLAIYYIYQGSFSSEAIIWIVLSTASEILYFVSLSKAYQTSSLSQAYPILRGTAPVVTTLLSLLLFGLTVEYAGLAGIFLIVCGILFINQERFHWSVLSATITKESYGGMKWIFLAGTFSGISSVIDSLGAAVMSGLFFKYIVYVGMFLGKWAIDQINNRTFSYRELLRKYPRETIAGGLFVFVSNSFAVYAMETTPVTYVSAVREIGIVFAAFIGVFWLKEKGGLVKWCSILLIMFGVIVIKMS